MTGDLWDEQEQGRRRRRDQIAEHLTRFVVGVIFILCCAICVALFAGVIKLMFLSAMFLHGAELFGVLGVIYLVGWMFLDR